VSLPEHPTHLAPTFYLSVCPSFVLSASPITAQLAPVRFSSNRSENKLTPYKHRDIKKVILLQLLGGRRKV
jgi:hypothetical protein